MEAYKSNSESKIVAYGSSGLTDQVFDESNLPTPAQFLSVVIVERDHEYHTDEKGSKRRG